MEVVHVKRILALGLAVVGLVVGLVVVRSAADALYRSASGADPTSVFNDIPPAPAELLDAIEWLPDPPRDGRAMEPTTRRLITDSYARALAALDRIGRGDPAAPLTDYLSGAALETALSGADTSDAVTVSTFHLRQRLRLDFYSDDGSVVAIGVPEVEIVRAVDGSAGRTITSTEEEWRFVMLLEDGNWRIRQIQTVDVEPPPLPAAPVPFDTAVRGANIPTAGGADHTWDGVDDEELTADLDAMVGLGLATARVFVAAPEVGEVDLDGFAEFLDLAGERGIGVVVTLFDGATSHHPSGWADDREYLERVVGGVAGHPAIVMWDLKNHPDLDRELSGGSVNVDAWLTRNAATVRRIDLVTPITIGWSSPDHAARVLSSIDVVSFQHLGEPAALGAAIEAATTAARGRPVMLAGFGVAEYAGRIRGHAPAAQAAGFADQIETVDRSELVGAIVWNLRDPAVAPSAGIARGAEALSFGLHTHDGTERPIAAVVSGGSDAVPAATIVELVRARAIPLLLAAAVAVLTARWWWKRRRERAGERPADPGTAVVRDGPARSGAGRAAGEIPPPPLWPPPLIAIVRRSVTPRIASSRPVAEPDPPGEPGSPGEQASGAVGEEVDPVAAAWVDGAVAGPRAPVPDEEAWAWVAAALATPDDGGDEGHGTGTEEPGAGVPGAGADDTGIPRNGTRSGRAGGRRWLGRRRRQS